MLGFRRATCPRVSGQGPMMARARQRGYSVGATEPTGRPCRQRTLRCSQGSQGWKLKLLRQGPERWQCQVESHLGRNRLTSDAPYKVGWPKARRAQSQAPARANVEPAADFDEEPLAARQARSALADLGDLAGRGGLAVGEAAQRRAESRARSAGRRIDGPERFPAPRPAARARLSGRAYWDPE